MPVTALPAGSVRKQSSVINKKTEKQRLDKFLKKYFKEASSGFLYKMLRKKNITLKREGEKEVFIRADEQKLKQLVLIFVDNALKYTPDGGSVSVRLSTPSPTRVSFDVQDTGIGISPEDQQKVFDRFYRVDKARSREMGGNGLGLAIAQEIVRLYNGIIDLKSEQGKGTTFTVTLRRGKE